MKINLIMAGFWLVIGGTILLYDPPGLRIPVGGGSVSAGWAALLLVAYNLVRWWTYRSARQAQDAVEADARRREQARREAEFPPGERNPDFLFDEPPKQQEGDRPPG
jgi:hypothetical protein